MSAQGVAVLLSWLSCCGWALWRYSTNTKNYLIFSTRSTIKLEYEGTLFSEWKVPKTCSVKNKRSPRTEMHCSSPGFQNIKPIVTGPNSAILSKQMATLGQRPVIYTFLRRKVYFPFIRLKNGAWVIAVPITTDDVLQEIKGNNVAFQDCFIADSLLPLILPWFTIPETPGFLPISSPQGSQLISNWDACAPASVVVVADVETFQTNDSFHTWTRIRVPTGSLTDNERHSVSDVTLTEDGIFFLIHGVLYVRSLTAFTRLGKKENLPEGDIIGITTRKWCWIKYLMKTLTFFQNINYEAVEDYFNLQYQNTGLLLLQVRPSQYGKTCPIPPKVFQIAVGCDNSKYIVVKGFNNKECLPHDFFYIIEKSFLRNQPSENLRVKYSWKKYGCPLRLDFREKFQPLIQLYDDSGFIEDVEVNFIVWEIHGRNDYSFNNTMKKSGCLNEAQTWKSMTKLNKDLPLEAVWGPENYKHCFSYAIGKPGDLNQPYEIINKSNYNHLIWPLRHTGMYVFRVKILDPNYRRSSHQVMSNPTERPMW
uniref:Catsper channel auxiliary subunit epsilon n=1 Tax=Molossus molossus TaxID=27622 RepID=A0A7J8BL80_MOLMO|nr:catsper channel auxiliary subunit epsilon [Molossus molossus]